MSGPFSGFGGGNEGGQNLEYQARLRKYFDDLERQQAESDAQRTGAAVDSFLSPLMGNYSPEELAARAGERNANGYIDPRMAPATQAMLQSLHSALRSGDPTLIKAAANSVGRVTDGMIPNAPGWPTQGQPTDDQKEYLFARGQGYQGSLEQWLQHKNQGQIPATQRDYHFAKSQGYGGSFLQYQQDLAGARRPAPGETAYDQTVGKQMGEDFITMQQAPTKRAGTLSQMQVLHDLLGDRGGWQGSNLAELKAAAARVGIDTEGKDADAAALSLQNSMALGLRSTADGGGMPGAMSDPDRNFLSRMVPGLDMSPGGRSKLLEVQRRLLSRENEVAQMARDYAGQHGRIDSGFYGQLASLRARPLFDDLATAGAPQAAASQSPIRVNSPQEAMQLAPGTLYTAPNGTTYRR